MRQKINLGLLLLSFAIALVYLWGSRQIRQCDNMFNELDAQLSHVKTIGLKDAAIPALRSHLSVLREDLGFWPSSNNAVIVQLQILLLLHLANNRLTGLEYSDWVTFYGLPRTDATSALLSRYIKARGDSPDEDKIYSDYFSKSGR